MVARELKRPGVTLQIVWEQCSGTQPDFYSYSRYCQLFREFKPRLTPSMRQNHVAGDKAFVDYSGKKVPNVRSAQRRDTSRRDLRRSTRSVQPDLCRGKLDTGLAGLDRRPCPDVQILGHGVKAVGTGPS